jgi:hypothetical protein
MMITQTLCPVDSKIDPTEYALSYMDPYTDKIAVAKLRNLPTTVEGKLIGTTQYWCPWRLDWISVGPGWLADDVPIETYMRIADAASWNSFSRA